MKKSKPRGRPVNEPISTRARLLAAATEVFNTDGYFGTDTNKIAAAAGFAPATFYRHFRDKKEVFLEAYRQWVLADWAVIAGAIKAGQTPRTRASAITRAHSAHHARWVKLRLSMHALAATDEEVRKANFSIRTEQLGRLREALRQAGAPNHSPGDLLYSFLCIERASNAVTDGDVAALGIAKAQMQSRIENEIVYLLTGHHES
jgi:AcrR family transcriptional regulator